MNCINKGKYTGDSCFGCEVKVKDCEIRDKVYRNRWVPVRERLPLCEEEVLILTKDDTITTAMYEDGKMPEEISMWVWYDLKHNYDKESGIYYVPEGWFEYRHFNPDDVYNNVVDEEVIAWMPLPEAYWEREQKC